MNPLKKSNNVYYLLTEEQLNPAIFEGTAIYELNFAKVSFNMDIFNECKEKFGFADWFGNNWDALFDSLTDEQFITKKENMVFIKGVERVYSMSKRSAFLLVDILNDACKRWDENYDYFHTRFNVIFILEEDFYNIFKNKIGNIELKKLQDINLD